MTARALRLPLLVASTLFGGSLGAQTLPAEQAVSELVLFADTDDDDADGVADGTEPKLEPPASTDVRWLQANDIPADRKSSAILSPVVRWISDGRPVPPGSALPARGRKVGLQGLLPGQVSWIVGARRFDVSVIDFIALDAQGARVDLARSHASISRTLPAFLANDDAGASDRDALRWIAVGAVGGLPAKVAIESVSPEGKKLDELSNVELWELPCPPGVPAELACRGSPLIRATADRIDRGHPESAGRSLRAEVGGKLVVHVAGRKAASVRVGGPRTTAVGPIERLRGRLRVHVLRSTPGGSPAVAGTASAALEVVREEVETANLLWGQCGIHFGTGPDVGIRLVDPPPSHLVAVGCGLGLPASGGEVRLRVAQRIVRVPTRSGESPNAVATRLATALRAQGFGASLSRNLRIAPGALETADVLVRQGVELANVERDGDAPVSTDPSLEVCIGTVDLSDGLSHFTDYDAVSGTLEERTLVKAYSDHDPKTLEVFVVPAFSGTGRVGESFLDAPGSSIHNVVIVDRAAIRAGARSHVLAHELGHVLLDMPGHPDDYGVDQPSALMDADATDPSIFGPRRLSVEECERVVRQSGPRAPLPLLESWPLFTTRAR